MLVCYHPIPIKVTNGHLVPLEHGESRGTNISDEKLIAECTGHRSQQSLQLYERKTNYDDNFVSAAITGAGGASAQFQAGELLGTGPVHVQLTTSPGMFTLPVLSVTEVERVFDNMSLECLDWVSEDLMKELYSPFCFHCNHH